ncbi:hypothetical protein GC105_09110 [Alkalibaculum sp. M08DMB]|uniref:DUF3168 domain-containing protein n=1 Tax=Alkalibaculum sporogenes TaxID=2655001 RepID=A0A6A7K8Z6_9FIRM|nr:minor capsid protein [Alkalibaculum sporogenes]MPW25948.1 hypothetical protein [Alkalibaculum sporogenes]
MNILDKIKSVLDMPDVKLGYLPDKPDGVTALFEYQGSPPDHHFTGTDIIENVQVRTRDTTSAAAYAKAKAVVSILNRYHDNEISVLQSTPILDIGYDNANPQRQEYTVNFEIRRY